MKLPIGVISWEMEGGEIFQRSDFFEIFLIQISWPQKWPKFSKMLLEKRPSQNRQHIFKVWVISMCLSLLLYLRDQPVVSSANPMLLTASTANFSGLGVKNDVLRIFALIQDLHFPNFYAKKLLYHFSSHHLTKKECYKIPLL